MKIFLAYAGEDREIAESVYLELIAGEHEVFFDKAKLPAAESYNSRIRLAVNQCDLFVFLVSPESVEPESYALTELKYAKKRWAHPQGRLLPVMTRPTAYDEIPPYIRAVTVLQPDGNLPAEVAYNVKELELGHTKRTPYIKYVSILALLLVVAFISLESANVIDLIPASEDKSLVEKFEALEKRNEDLSRAIEELADKQQKLLTTAQQEAAVVKRVEKSIDPSRGKLWSVGETLSVRFLAGTTEEQKIIRQAAKAWEEVANIHFEFVSTGDADLRISFDSSGGAWSLVGTDALGISQSQATSNFGWTDQATAMHELGHVLGLSHEHANPNRTFTWDQDVVLKELSGPPNFWNADNVEQNIFRTWPDDALPISKRYDKDSIMHYAFSNNWFTDGKERGGAKQLSNMDKEYIALLYPQN